jgi:predicted nucleic acid-binding protein
MIVLDTSGLPAWIDASQRLHDAVAESMKNVSPPYLLSPFVLAELDYLVATRVGRKEEHTLLEEIEGGAYDLVTFTNEDVGRARSVLMRFEDLEIGLADASIVIIAERYRTHDVLTLDERRFRTLTGSDGRPFRLLPADA